MTDLFNVHSLAAGMSSPDATFIRDLSLVIVTAATTAVLFKLLRLPVLMGYLLAGMLIGPNIFGESLIADHHTLEQISELGVIFLMFYIGMEFELGLLKRVLAPSLVAVTLQTAAMLLIGLMIAPLIGWSRTEGLFLGGLLAISSSMVTIQVFRERGVLNHPHAQLAMGILIMEDVLAIALLVILTGVGVTGQLVMEDVWQVAFLIGVFVVAVYFVGRLLARPLLNLLHRFNNPEIITLTTMAMVLGVGEMAAQFHFSVALGAFLAGAILCRSSLAEDIEHLTTPLRMLFSAIFFVSVGMFIDPAVLLEQWKVILALSLLVIAGKSLTCFIGLAATGNPIRPAMRAALGKAQIGEFSFVIAALGESLGVTGPELTAVAAGVALVTILTTFPLSSGSLSIYQFVRGRAPNVVVHIGRTYQGMFKATGEALSRNELFSLIKKPLIATVGYVFLFFAVVMLATVISTYVAQIRENTYYQSAVWMFAALIAVPTVVAIVRHLDSALLMLTETVMGTKGKLAKDWREHLRPVFYVFSWSLIVLGFGGIFTAAAAEVFPSGVALTVFISLLVGVSVFFWSRLNRLNSHVECLFLESFQQEAHSLGGRKREEVRRRIEQRYPWSMKLSEVLIETRTCACGQRIRELNLRAQTGAMIIAICRDQYTHFDPSPDAPLFPGDRLVLLGTDQNTADAQKLLKEPVRDVVEDESVFGGFEIDSVYIEKASSLEGNTLAGAQLRSHHGVSVIGIQRGDERITSPAANELMLAGDLLWLAGSHASIESLKDIGGTPA